MNSHCRMHGSPFRGAGLLFLLVLFACAVPLAGLFVDQLAYPSERAHAAAPFTVPAGYGVRAYDLGELTLVMVILPGDEDPEQNLYALWGVTHQAQARRIDAEVRGCYEIGDLTAQCDDRLTVTTFGSERGSKRGTHVTE